MKYTSRYMSLALAAIVGFGPLCLPVAAHASEEGKRNTAIGIGAAAVGLLLTQKNKLPGVVAAAGAAYAYSQYDKDVKNRHNRDRYYGYDDSRSNSDRYSNDSRYNNNDRTTGDSRYNNDQYNNDRYSNDSRYNTNDRYRDNSGSRYDNQDNCNNQNEGYSSDRSARRSGDSVRKGRSAQSLGSHSSAADVLNRGRH